MLLTISDLSFAAISLIKPLLNPITKILKKVCFAIFTLSQVSGGVVIVLRTRCFR